MSEKPTYGNPSINRLMAYMKQVNGNMLDGSIKKNRFHCSTMLKRVAGWFPGHDAEELLMRLIDTAKADKFHGPKTTSFTYLLYHGAQIIQQAQALKKTTHGTRQEHARASAEALARKLADQG